MLAHIDPRMTIESFMESMGPGYQKFWEDHGIKLERIKPDSNVFAIGLSEKEQKWYGWSHRAIFGFGIGDTVKKGDCGYIADNPEEMIEDHANFFADISQEVSEEKRRECAILPDRSGIRILHTPLKIKGVNADDPEMIEKINKSLEEGGNVDHLTEMTLFEDSVSIKKCGRGQWTAMSLGDCKIMAIQFAESVG